MPADVLKSFTMDLQGFLAMEAEVYSRAWWVWKSVMSKDDGVSVSKKTVFASGLQELGSQSPWQEQTYKS